MMMQSLVETFSANHILTSLFLPDQMAGGVNYSAATLNLYMPAMSPFLPFSLSFLLLADFY